MACFFYFREDRMMYSGIKFLVAFFISCIFLYPYWLLVIFRDLPMVDIQLKGYSFSKRVDKNIRKVIIWMFLGMMVFFQGFIRSHLEKEAKIIGVCILFCCFLVLLGSSLAYLKYIKRRNQLNSEKGIHITNYK